MVKDPFITVVAIIVNGADGSFHSMNLNFGMSLGVIDGELGGGYRKSVSLISQFSKDFDSRVEAEGWVEAGGCDLPSAGELSYVVNRGEMMWEDREVFEKIDDYIVVAVN